MLVSSKLRLKTSEILSASPLLNASALEWYAIRIVVMVVTEESTFSLLIPQLWALFGFVLDCRGVLSMLSLVHLSKACWAGRSQGARVLVPNGKSKLTNLHNILGCPAGKRYCTMNALTSSLMSHCMVPHMGTHMLKCLASGHELWPKTQNYLQQPCDIMPFCLAHEHRNHVASNMHQHCSEAFRFHDNTPFSNAA